MDFSSFDLCYPGEDAQHIMWNLAYKQVQDNDITDEQIEKANKIFHEGYRYQDLMTTEAWSFFDVYWTIRTIYSYQMSNKTYLIDKSN